MIGSSDNCDSETCDSKTCVTELSSLSKTVSEEQLLINMSSYQDGMLTVDHILGE